MLDVARCKACGRPYHVPVVGGYIAPQILTILQRHSAGKSLEQIAASVYYGKDQPENWRKALHVCIHKMNKKLQPFGWKVKATHLGEGAVYQLVAWPAKGA